MNKKRVRQLTLKGEFIKSFDTMKEAAKELNVDYYGISKCCNFSCDHVKGFKFEFENNK